MIARELPLSVLHGVRLRWQSKVTHNEAVLFVVVLNSVTRLRGDVQIGAIET